MSLPSAPFDTAKSIFAGLAIIELTPTGGTKVVFESRLLTSKLEQEIKDISRPDSKGVLRKVRTVLTKQQESFTFEIDEAKRLLDIFANSLAGRVTGVCTLWLPDPDDLTGKIALKSEVGFACTITRDGDMPFGNSEFAKATINLESNKQGPITWTADASYS
jgi:hypothetical protein